MINKLLQIFLLAFLFNFIWENFHSGLYIHYQGNPITQLHLLRAALVDASFITVVGWLFLKFQYLKSKLWLAVTIGVVAAILLELYALQTNRWAYSDLMPIIPILGTGLTPTIQLGLLTYLVFKIVKLDNR